MSLYKYKISDTFKIINGIQEYDLNKCYAYLMNQGKSVYGQEFVIHENKFKLMYALLIYAIKDEEKAEVLQLNLNKGMLLMGPSGAGKTCFIHLIKPFLQASRQYNIVSCRAIGFEFNKNGYSSIEQYTKTPINQKRKIICFDDFGNESLGKHFGSTCNFMKEIIEMRYDLFHTHKQATHVITSLTPSEIEQKYGRTVREKMREMFNLLVFPY